MNLKIICRKLISSFLILELLLASTLTKGADAKESLYASCGSWGLKLNSDRNTSQDGKISIELIDAADSRCEGAFTLKNETDIFSLGGYTLQLRTEVQNAKVRLLDRDFLLPSLPVDIKAEPIDPKKSALVQVYGEMTLDAYFYDYAFFIVKTILTAIPSPTCIIPNETIAFVSFRIMNIIQGAAAEFAEGNYHASFNEFSKVFNYLLDAIIEGFKEVGEGCVVDALIKFKFIDQKWEIFWTVAKWLVPWYRDYFKGEISYLILSYILDEQPTPITPTPVDDTPPDASDPNYVYSQVKKAIKYKDASFLQEFYTGELDINGSLLEACALFPDWVSPPLSIIEEHLNGALKCEGIQYESRNLAIFYSGWDPEWVDCSNPDNVSDTAGFLFSREFGGDFKLSKIQVSTMEGYNSPCCGWEGEIPYNKISCEVEKIPDIEQAVCPDALPQRLKIGGKGIVCSPQGAIGYIYEPGDAGPFDLTPVPYGTEFEVFSGPFCIGDGKSWYYIGNPKHIFGYVAEGGNEEEGYFLCPLDDSSTTMITPTPFDNTPLVTPEGPDPRVDYSNMVYIPSGEFQMGCDETQDKDCFNDGSPVHTVYLDAFFIDKYEVTNQQYEECVNIGACEPPKYEGSSTRSSYFGDTEYQDYPVLSIDSNNAFAYCSWWGKRLPTEAEWEKAARGTSANKYPWGNEEPNCNLANFRFSSGTYCVGDTAPVGSYPAGASPYGVMDMAGNAQEWVVDCYDHDYYKYSPYYNPVNSDESFCNEILRGGSWEHYSDKISTYYRETWSKASVPLIDDFNIGFRCVADAELTTNK